MDAVEVEIGEQRGVGVARRPVTQLLQEVRGQDRGIVALVLRPSSEAVGEPELLRDVHVRGVAPRLIPRIAQRLGPGDQSGRDGVRASIAAHHLDVTDAVQGGQGAGEERRHRDASLRAMRVGLSEHACVRRPAVEEGSSRPGVPAAGEVIGPQ